MAQRRQPSVQDTKFRGQPAVRLSCGPVTATFLPGHGLTGVSLRYGRAEFLAIPGGLDALRAGRTAGLPLLAPWANRLSRWHYRVGRTRVDLTGLPLGTDDNGLPIHGLLCGRPAWTITGRRTSATTAGLDARVDVDDPAFPFPHTLVVRAEVDEGGLTVTTTLHATGRRAVPAAFGWHPYLRLPGTPRGEWTLHLPARRHVALDDRGIPSGGSKDEPAQADEVRRRTFDDLYRIRRSRDWAITSAPGYGIRMSAGPGYDYAQVWVPAGRTFLALEPMTVATDALVRGDARMVAPGESFAARFRLALTAPQPSRGGH